MSRYYIVPKTGSGARGDSFRPKYFDGISHSSVDYGAMPVFLTKADTDDIQHTAISLNLDVIALPSDLDSSFSGLATNRTKSALEGINVPADWLSPGMSYREALRVIYGMFAMLQSYMGATGSQLFVGGVSPDTKFGQLSAAQQKGLLDAAAGFGMDTSFISSNTALRAILKSFSDQIRPRLDLPA